MSERLNTFFETLKGELMGFQPVDEPQRFAIERQLERARKRARIHKSDLRDKAVNSFVETNRLVRDFSVTLAPDVEANARHFIRYVLERYTASITEDAIQTVLDLGILFNNWRFGPGASNGVKGTHTVEKIEQPMTCNAPSEFLVRKLRQLNPYLSRFDCDNSNLGTALVRGSRLSTVLKNEDTERTISIEPSGQMALQLPAGGLLEGGLRCIGLDIRTQQPKNKAAAMRGSIDGSLATIDMKSASDMISVKLVRQLFPREWVWLLEILRSRETMLPNGEWLELHMISTMGNGFTFPLMTLIIVALIYAYRCRNGGPSLYVDWTDTCVFGDDVIVPTHEYAGVCEILTSAGFVINTDKSFSEGPFRESCGGDYYLGRDVTPFYVKSLDEPAQIYVAINQLLEWSEKTKVFPHKTLLLLKSYLGGKVLLVPEWFNPDQGVLTAQCSRQYKYLEPKLPRVRFSDESVFAMMLAVGGYIGTSGPYLFYTPRPRKVRYVVRKGRMPRGFLSGWDPRKRTQLTSESIGLITQIIFG